MGIILVLCYTRRARGPACGRRAAGAGIAGGVAAPLQAAPGPAPPDRTQTHPRVAQIPAPEAA